MRVDVVKRLRALRRKSGKTAKAVSATLEKNEFYISRMEKGIFLPGLPELEKILAEYNSSLEELFYDEFERFHFEKEVIEKLRTIGKKQENIIMGILALAFEINNKREGKEDEENAV